MNRSIGRRPLTQQSRPAQLRVERLIGLLRSVALRWRVQRLRGMAADAGMSTAEYAVGLVAACAFAALLYKILTSSQMESLLRDLISRALHVTF